MQRHTANGLVWYTFTGPGPGLLHALVTRLGGVSRGPYASLNLGSTVGDDPAAVQENLRRLRATFSLSPTQIVSPHQVHEAHVARVTRTEGGLIIPATDALITDDPEVALLLRFADCAPILLYDRRRHVAGLVHAGWRGVVARVVPAAVAALRETFGSSPHDLWVGIGPCISGEHYQVGAEIVAAVAAAVPRDTVFAWRHDGSWYLDLATAILAQLQACNVAAIEMSGLCTASNLHEWYSHRAEGGHTGRFGVLVKLQP